MAKVIEFLQSLFHIELNVYPHWKYFLIPMLLLVGSSIKATWAMQTGSNFERKASAIAMIFYGLPISLLASALSGAIDIKSGSLLPAIIPMFGLIAINILTVLWDVILKTKQDKTRSEILSYYLVRDILSSIAAALLCIGFGIWSQSLLGENNSVIVFVLFISIVSIRSLISGRIEESRHEPGEEIFVGAKKYESASTRVGLLNARSIGAAITFLVFNAGLQLAGIA